jgi:deoxyuridine 5'-triphosphate nucleotidohydrolase
LILDHSKIFPTIDKKYHTSILAGIHDCCADSKGLLTFTTDWCSNIANFIIDTIDVPIKEKGDTWVKYDYVNYIDFRYVIYTYIDTRDPLVSKVYLDDSAIFPTKAHGSDVGYDLTIIKKVKDLTGNTGLFDTGIKVTPPNGFYTEIVPRSSLSKSGYILANSVGIIDPGYNGNLLIALTKIDQSCEDLVLPFKCCQLIFKFQYHNIKLEKCIELSDTTRNDGGFGSSDLV